VKPPISPGPAMSSNRPFGPERRTNSESRGWSCSILHRRGRCSRAGSRSARWSDAMSSSSPSRHRRDSARRSKRWTDNETLSSQVTGGLRPSALAASSGSHPHTMQA
jgi:hypothetical protein